MSAEQWEWSRECLLQLLVLCRMLHFLPLAVFTVEFQQGVHNLLIVSGSIGYGADAGIVLDKLDARSRRRAEVTRANIDLVLNDLNGLG